jgi:hypothetical protein
MLPANDGLVAANDGLLPPNNKLARNDQRQMGAHYRAMEQREGSIGKEASNIHRFSLSYKMQIKKT